MADKVNPLVVSYSYLELLHSCPRKFELEKFLFASSKEDNIDFITGKALHVGIQLLLQGYNIQTAIWAAYKEWSAKLHLDAFNKKKAFWRVVKHLEKFSQSTLVERFISKGWELVYFKNEQGERIPAIEIAFKVIISEEFHYRGSIDAILYNQETDEFAVFEIKSTGIRPDPAQYKNSFQGSSYSLILDKITGRRNYKVLYPVFQFPDIEFECFEFTKTEGTKLRWLMSMALDFEMIQLYKKHRHFPMRGGSCYNFFRPCAFLGTCELSTLGKKAEDGNYLPQPEDRDYDGEEINYHFTFSLQELLTEELEKST